MKCWVGLVGWPIADGLPTCGHPSAAGRAWDRESSPVNYWHSTNCATQLTTVQFANFFVFSLYAHKRPSPFFYTYPTKRPSFNDKRWISCIWCRPMVSWVQLNQQTGSAKNCPTTNPASRLCKKSFYTSGKNLFMGVHKVHINISLVGLGLGLVTLVLDFDCLVVVVWLRNVSLSGQWFNKLAPSKIYTCSSPKFTLWAL